MHSTSIQLHAYKPVETVLDLSSLLKAVVLFQCQEELQGIIIQANKNKKYFLFHILHEVGITFCYDEMFCFGFLECNFSELWYLFHPGQKNNQA